MYIYIYAYIEQNNSKQQENRYTVLHNLFFIKNYDNLQ